MLVRSLRDHSVVNCSLEKKLLAVADLGIRHSWQLDPESVRALAAGVDGNPFAVLGPHDTHDGRIIRAMLPGAVKVEVVRQSDGCLLCQLEPSGDAGLFENFMQERAPYRLRIFWPQGVQETEDPYSFGLLLGDIDLHLFNEGRHFQLAQVLGAQPLTIGGVNGVRFSVWAPNATRVAVVGDFNSWDRRRHAMRVRHGAGIWELFLPRVAPGSRYKYDIISPDGVHLPWKADPLARQTETPPNTASVVPQPYDHSWHDQKWMSERGKRQAPVAPISIYEVHLGSWLKPDGRTQAGSLWDFATERLLPYLVDMGFTHVELLPITEHPFGGSWGYQPLGLFAPTARYGPPKALSRFRRCAARCWHRHHPRLGAGSFSNRPTWAGPFRRHGALRAPRSARRLSSRLEYLHLQFRPAGSAGLPDRQRTLLA